MSDFGEDKDWHARVQHMVMAAEEILEYTKGKTAQSFMSDRMMVRGVERCFEIVGEAARKVPKDVCARYNEVPWDRITGLRNILAHDYDKTREMILWTTIQNDLPALVSILKMIEKN